MQRIEQPQWTYCQTLKLVCDQPSCRVESKPQFVPSDVDFHLRLASLAIQKEQGFTERVETARKGGRNGGPMHIMRHYCPDCSERLRSLPDMVPARGQVCFQAGAL